MPSVPPLSVAIVHAEPLIVAGVMFALRHEPGVVVRHPAEDDDLVPSDLVIADHATALRLTGCGGSAQHLRRSLRVMVVASQAREAAVRAAVEAGVRGYVLASCHTDEVVRCIHALAGGSRYLSAAVAECMADSFQREPLTVREIDVLRLLMHGGCNKEIARSLDIAVGTVKAHLKAIMDKLDARSRTHAVTIAASRGLVPGFAGGATRGGATP